MIVRASEWSAGASSSAWGSLHSLLACQLCCGYACSLTSAAVADDIHGYAAKRDAVQCCIPIILPSPASIMATERSLATLLRSLQTAAEPEDAYA